MNASDRQRIAQQLLDAMGALAYAAAAVRAIQDDAPEVADRNPEDIATVTESGLDVVVSLENLAIALDYRSMDAWLANRRHARSQSR